MTVMHYPSLETLAEQEHRNASWWASVARALDDLDEWLRQDAAAVCGQAGAFSEAVSRQPSLSNEVTRLLADRNRLHERTRRLRQLVGNVAGDERQVSAVSSELAHLAVGEERYRRRSRDLIWESFVRDIGGE